MLKDPLPPITVRGRIMAALAQRFTDAKQGVGGRWITWNAVTDCPITKTQGLIGSTIGVYDARERKSPEIAYTRSALQVNTEFHVKLAKGDNPSQIAGLVLGEVQSIMLADIYTGGLTLNIVEVGNELEVDGPLSAHVGGVVFWEVLYRHKVGDPRKLQGEK